MNDAACRNTGYLLRQNDIFFPGRGETDEEAILGFCFKCTVKSECEAWGNSVNAVTGIWGGQRRTRGTHGSEKDKTPKKPAPKQVTEVTSTEDLELFL